MSLRQIVPDPTIVGDTQIIVDVVAVHGLNPRAKRKEDHALDTWRSPPGPDGHLWLRDDLPDQIPNSRIFVYQYDATAVFGSSQATFVDNASDLLEKVRLERRDAPKRPIIFLGHSMGGLLIKQALINAHSNPIYNPIKTATSGLVFFATPHRGGNRQMVNIGQLAANIAITCGFRKGDNIFEVLKEGTMFSELMREQWRHQLFNYNIISCWGKDDKVVRKESATIGLPGNQENPLQLEADHSQVCKFGDSPKDKENLKAVMANIVDLYHKALMNALPEVGAPTEFPNVPDLQTRWQLLKNH